MKVPISCSSPALTWMAWTSLLLSSRAAEAVDDPKEAAPRCSPRMRRPSFLYCSMGSHSRSRNPWTGGQDYQRCQACPGLSSLPRALTPFPIQFLFLLSFLLPILFFSTLLSFSPLGVKWKLLLRMFIRAICLECSTT